MFGVLPVVDALLNFDKILSSSDKSTASYISIALFFPDLKMDDLVIFSLHALDYSDIHVNLISGQFPI